MVVRPDHRARRLRLLPGGPDSLALGERRGLRRRPGPQRPARTQDRTPDAALAEPLRLDRRGVEVLPVLPLPDVEKLEPDPEGGGQGRGASGAWGDSPALWSSACRDRNSTPGRSARTASAPGATWRTGPGSSSWSCSPTATMRANRLRLFLSAFAGILTGLGIESIR